MEALSERLWDLGLFLVQIEGWILIQRTSFDTYMEGEPFQSMQVYANPAANKYLIRAWGRTVKVGDWNSVDDVRRLCESYFMNTAVCAGYPGTRPFLPDELVLVEYPYPRWISKACSVIFSQNSEDTTVGLCSACSGTSFTITKVVAETKSAMPEEGEIDQKSGPLGPNLPKDSITITKIITSESPVPEKEIPQKTVPPTVVPEEDPKETGVSDAHEEDMEPKVDSDQEQEADGAAPERVDDEDWSWPVERSHVETPTQVRTFRHKYVSSFVK